MIEGGSRAYIEPLTKGFRDKIRLNAPVEWLRRSGQGIELQVHGKIEHFDEVIFACHSDQALALLSDANYLERELLGAMGYQANEVILHTDTSLLPKRKAAWASWNYRLAGEADQETRLPALTYNMNILQHINSSETFCVTLNSSENINPNKVLRKFTYHHPVFNRAAIAAQQRKAEISGVNHTWFCGAYWHNGFHEDGVKSALDVVTRLSSQPDIAQQGAA